MGVTPRGPYSFESSSLFTVMSKQFQVLGFCGENGLAVGKCLWLLILIFSVSLINDPTAQNISLLKKKEKKTPNKRQTLNLKLLVSYKIHTLSQRSCCKIHSSVIGRNIIFLKDFFSSVYKFTHFQCQSHMSILHSYVLQWGEECPLCKTSVVSYR